MSNLQKERLDYGRKLDTPSLIACYLKEIKFIDNEWYKENDFINFSENQMIILNNERIILKALRINCLNKTIDNLKIPKKYLLNIEPICVKQYLLKFLIKKIENPFEKIIINNKSIPLELLNNNSIWIDEGSNVEIFLRKNINNCKLLNETHILIPKMLEPRIFKIDYEEGNISFFKENSFIFFLILVFSIFSLLFIKRRKEEKLRNKMFN